MTSDYRKSHLAPEKGRDYHAMFSKEPFRAMIWEFEQRILSRTVEEFYSGRKITHLDFACGTGRILKFLETRVSLSVGVDLSPSMLQVARENCLKAEIVEADLTQNDVLGDRKFNLITAFRFFPNAEQSLREEGMAVMSSHLADDGCLVFNNHKNLSSTRNRLARLCGRYGYQGMGLQEVKGLVRNAGLEIVKTYPLNVFPAAEGRPLLPIPILRGIESVLSRCSALKNFGENVIYVCRRAA